MQQLRTELLEEVRKLTQHVARDKEANERWARIQAQLQARNPVRAFELALDAANLGVVVRLCNAVPSPSVLGEPCQMPQTMVLSLIQQLSHDMADDTAIKLEYLQSALTALKPQDPTIRAHVADVMRQLTGALAVLSDATLPPSLVTLARTLRYLVAAVAPPDLS